MFRKLFKFITHTKQMVFKTHFIYNLPINITYYTNYIII